MVRCVLDRPDYEQELELAANAVGCVRSRHNRSSVGSQKGAGLREGSSRTQPFQLIICICMTSSLGQDIQMILKSFDTRFASRNQTLHEQDGK